MNGKQRRKADRAARSLVGKRVKIKSNNWLHARYGIKEGMVDYHVQGSEGRVMVKIDSDYPASAKGSVHSIDVKYLTVVPDEVQEG